MLIKALGMGLGCRGGKVGVSKDPGLRHKRPPSVLVPVLL